MREFIEQFLLHRLSDFRVEWITEWSSQVSTVLTQKNLEQAMRLDLMIEQLCKTHSQWDWCGVYILQGTVLKLAAFRGAPSPHSTIPLNRGICGAAVRENRSLNIEDVSKDPRYLACDIRTRSELVVPIRDSTGLPIGEIDIDSHTASTFTAIDVEEVEKLAREMSEPVLKLI